MDLRDFDRARLQCHGFTYLSPSAFTLTHTDPQVAYTLLISFDPTGQIKLPAQSMIRQAVRLLFPEPYVHRNRVLYITVGSSSLARPEPRRQAFLPSPELRLQAFFMKVVHDEEQLTGSQLLDTVLMIIVKTSALLSWLSSGTHTGQGIPWSEWAPGNVRIVEQGETSHLSDV